MKKTKKDILNQYYVSQTDIQRLLGISYKHAKKVFDILIAQQDEEFRIYDRKVPLKDVLGLMRINYNFLRKQVDE